MSVWPFFEWLIKLIPYGNPDQELEAAVRRWALGLRAMQVVCPNSVSSLEELANQPALLCGRRFNDGKPNQNQNNPKLFKVGLEGDIIPDEALQEKTRENRTTLSQKLTLTSKLHRYLFSSRKKKLYRIFGYTGGRLRDFMFGRDSVVHHDLAWSRIPGVNFLLGNDYRFTCIDHGGIYEDYLTTRSSRHPSQVGMDLYTTSNAGYLFNWMAQHDPTDPLWPQARDATKTFFLSFFHHPRQRLEFNHREFDFTAVTLTFGPLFAAPFSGWTRYDPVNVFGLRWDNLAHGEEKHPLRHHLKKILIKAILLLNQAPSGLIADNFRGRTRDSADLTYHHYCLAGLCMGNQTLRDPTVDKIICKGVLFSLKYQLADGEVSYYGRGANNVYHLVAFMVALRYTREIFGWDVNEPLQRALDYLTPYWRSEPGCATPQTINAAPFGEMVGWHGSCAQYGAQSAFLLARALDFHGEQSKHRPMPLISSHQHLASAHLHWIIASDTLQVAVTTGGEIVSWNSGDHISGLPGMTALLYNGHNLLLTNEETRQPNGELVQATDHPEQRESGRLEDCLPNSTKLRWGRRDNTHYCTYRIEGDKLHVNLFTGKRRTTARHALALKGSVNIVNEDGNTVLLRLADEKYIHVTTSTPIRTELRPVTINCQGNGVMATFYADTNQLTITYTFKSPTDILKKEDFNHGKSYAVASGKTQNGASR